MTAANPINTNHPVFYAHLAKGAVNARAQIKTCTPDHARLLVREAVKEIDARVARFTPANPSWGDDTSLAATLEVYTQAAWRHHARYEVDAETSLRVDDLIRTAEALQADFAKGLPNYADFVLFMRAGEDVAAALVTAASARTEAVIAWAFRPQ